MSEMVERVAEAMRENERKPDSDSTWRGVARAAIAAMREPTGEMIKAGCDYRAMIDAALGQKP